MLDEIIIFIGCLAVCVGVAYYVNDIHRDNEED